jgi:hypothetical protein
LKQLLPSGKCERSALDFANANIKFDGSRIGLLADNRLLIATSKGEFKIIHIKFDQA